MAKHSNLIAILVIFCIVTYVTGGGALFQALGTGGTPPGGKSQHLLDSQDEVEDFDIQQPERSDRDPMDGTRSAAAQANPFVSDAE